MSELKVAQQGEAILTLQASPVMAAEFASEWLSVFCRILHDTMQARQGVGIAAPQVYLSKCIIIVASRPNARYPEAPEMDPILMINPQIIQRSEQSILGEEGCLSVPELRGQVARAAQIQVRYATLTGEEVEREFSGFPARIVQHEIDHLEGILFVQRLNV